MLLRSEGSPSLGIRSSVLIATGADAALAVVMGAVVAEVEVVLVELVTLFAADVDGVEEATTGVAAVVVAIVGAAAVAAEIVEVLVGVDGGSEVEVGADSLSSKLG